MTRSTNSNGSSQKTDPLRSAVAGAIAGAFSKTATAPIERVKLLLQVRDSNKGASQYGNTVWQVTRAIYRQEGFFAFWRGNTPSVIQKGGSSALNFLLMDWYKSTNTRLMKRIYGGNPQEESKSFRTMNSFLSAGLAGGTTTTFLYPLEFLKTRLAVDLAKAQEQRQYSGMRDVLVYTIKEDGVRGIYKGFGTSVAFVTMHRVVYLGGFDVLKIEMLRSQRKQSLTMGERLIAAQFVSMLAGIVCYPLDTVRRRLMMQAGLHQKQYRNWWDCTRKIYRYEGIRGFFKGLGPNLAKTFGRALLLVAYDSVRGVM